MSDEYPDWYDVEDTFPCPHCSGFGEVDCHCGGDLCVCTNYGSKSCSVCGGEGEVTDEVYEAYEKRKRESFAFIADLLAKSKA